MSEIVLLDTTSDLNNINCISIPFDENAPKYYAISYRWGVLPEWKVQTPNYVASITSIPRGNLIKLCGILRGKVRYIWIDVVCINQADVFHRKMAIKNMDNIYRRAKRIIAVPDLCYCSTNSLIQHITEADIAYAIYVLCIFENLQTMSRAMELSNPHLKDAITFILKVIQEWACRCWVISERVIGVKHNKLDIIAITANGAELPCQQWKDILPINWNINFSQATLIDTIINSKSTKYIDRLFAILPHTRYKDAVQKLVDEGVNINSMMDLKLALCEILDTEGQLIMLDLEEKQNIKGTERYF